MKIIEYKQKIQAGGILIFIIAVVIGILLYIQNKPTSPKLQVSDEVVEMVRQELEIPKPETVTQKVEQVVRKELQKAPVGGGLTEEEKAKIRAELQKTNN